MEEGEVVEEVEEDVDGGCVEVMRPSVGLQRLGEHLRLRSIAINSSTGEMSLNQISERGFALLVSKQAVLTVRLSAVIITCLLTVTLLYLDERTILCVSLMRARVK